LALLDVLQIRLDRYSGNAVQPENWELAVGPGEDDYVVQRRFDRPQDAEILISYLDQNRPLLHSYSDRLPADDPLLKRRLSHSLSIIRPLQLHWRVSRHPAYANKLKVQAEFRFVDDPYCLVVTDPLWEAQCRRTGLGLHPHSAIERDKGGLAMLTISLAEKPLNGFHYKLVAGVIPLKS
jgi:hypothetical protein